MFYADIIFFVNIFNGNEEAKKLEKQIEKHLQKNKVGEELAIIISGENPASVKYVQLKKALCDKYSIPVNVYHLESNMSHDNITREIRSIVDNNKVGSAIIQLPLPDELDNKLPDLIPISKDIDLLSCKSMTMLQKNNNIYTPPVIRSFKYFIDYYKMDLRKITTTVIGSGRLIGLPLSYYISNYGGKCVLVNNYKKGMTLSSDLVVTGVGIPGIIDPHDLKVNSDVIDFGSSIKDGRTAGDLDYLQDMSHLKNVSPSPGGMGPLVVKFLIMNHLRI